VLLVGATSSRKADSVVSNRMGMKFGKIVFQVNTHRLTDMTSYFLDGGHDVISRRKVLPSGDCMRSVCPVHMQQRPHVPYP